MKTIILLLITALSLPAFAQKQIKLEEAKNHIGDSVMMSGVIYDIKVFEDDDKKPTLALINLGAAYPNQIVTIAVRPELYKNTGIVFPDQRFKGDLANVTGKIELYKGKPQIIIHSAEQLHISAADPVVAPKQ
jgi:hypothetical protein